MSTETSIDRVSAALFGKARRAVLALLYGRPDEAFYLRQIARVTGVGLGAVQREVNRLAGAGILRRFVQGRHVYFQAERTCQIFEELKSLVVKTAGVGEVLRAALAPLAERIEFALVYGSMARSRQRRASDVDLLVIGDATFAEIVAALTPVQQVLGREINPTVYPAAEFQAKMAAGHHFLTTVLRGSWFLLIGDERGLTGVAGERLAD
jgi:uncharacterized protein